MSKTINLPQTRKELVVDRLKNLVFDVGWAVFAIALSLVIGYLVKAIMIA